MIAARPARAGVGPAGVSRSALRDRRVLTTVPLRREVSGTLRRQPGFAWTWGSRAAGRWMASSAPTSWGG
jgi:hypothetical protein